MEIKVCPFCGSKAVIEKVSKIDECKYEDWRIKCTKCPAMMDLAADRYYGRVAFTEEEVIEF